MVLTIESREINVIGRLIFLNIERLIDYSNDFLFVISLLIVLYYVILR